MASNAVETRKRLNASVQSGLPLIEAFRWRNHPVAARISHIATSGVLGKLQDISVRFSYPSTSLEGGDFRFSYAMSGGILMDAGCYWVNLLRMVLGEPLKLRTARAILAAEQVDVAMAATLEFKDEVIGR